MQNKEVIFRQEEDEAIIFNPDNSDIIVINSTGCFIWQSCDGKNTTEEIVNKMLDELDVTAERANKDLDQFLSDLEKRNFLKKIS
jgi:methyltransferase-like protein